MIMNLFRNSEVR